MSVTKVRGWFSKPGKGFPQVELKNFDGTPQVADGKPVIGNEQYEADQLTNDSISAESAEAFMIDALEACGDDLAFLRESFLTGWNRVSRLKSGGLDDYQKAAKKIMSLGLPNYKGKTLDQIADQLRAQEA